MRERRTRCHRDDAGVSMILFALVLTAMLAISAIAVDLGQAYANRRQSQNAADAAAMAGTRWIAQNRYATPAPTTVSGLVDVVSEVVTDNEAEDGADLHCWIVNNATTPQRLPLGAPVDVCQAPGTAWSLFWNATDWTRQAQGVEVGAAKRQDTLFASVVFDIRSTNATTSATATMQPVVGLGAPAPFILCSKPEGQHFLLDPADTSQIRQQAIDAHVLLSFESNKEENSPSCLKDKSNSGLDGKLDQNYDVTIGQPAEIVTGNGTVYWTGPSVVGAPAGMCQTIQNHVPANGCLVILPIADEAYAKKGNGAGTQIVLIPKAFAVFELWGDGFSNTSPYCQSAGPETGHTKWCGYLVDEFEISGGETGTGGVGDNEAFEIRLVR